MAQSEIRKKLHALNERFSEDLLLSIKEIPVGEMDDSGVLESDEIWWYKDSTGQQQDRMMRIAQNEGMFAGMCEAILLRCCDDVGKALFSDADRPFIKKLNPDLVYAIGNEMKAFDDVSPTVEEAEKKSPSTLSLSTDAELLENGE